MQFVDLLTKTLEAKGYNVKVLITNIASGSVVVSSTTQFLDGSVVGATALADSLTTDANTIFPSSTYGEATAIATVTSVSNPSRFSSFLLLHSLKLYYFITSLDLSAGSNASKIQASMIAIVIAAAMTAFSVFAF